MDQKASRSAARQVFDAMYGAVFGMDEQQTEKANADLERNQRLAGFYTDEALKLFAYGALACSVAAAALTFDTWPLYTATVVLTVLIWSRINWLITHSKRIRFINGRGSYGPLLRYALITALMTLVVVVGFAFHLKGVYEQSRREAPPAPALDGAVITPDDPRAERVRPGHRGQE